MLLFAHIRKRYEIAQRDIDGHDPGGGTPGSPKVLPCGYRGANRKPDRDARSGSDSCRGAEPISVKQTPSGCDGRTTVKRPISALGDEG